MFHYQRAALLQRVFTPPGDLRKKVTTPKIVPYGAVAHLSLHFGQQTFLGTGFLFKRETVHNDYYAILTAAHNLYNEELQCYADEVNIRFGRDGIKTQQMERGITKMTEDFRVPRQFIRDDREGSDFGIITLDSSDYDKCPLNDAFEPMMFRLKDDPISKVKLSGYPGVPIIKQEGYPGYPKFTQWKVDVNITNVTSTVLEYRDATTPGNSGSPVFMKIPDHNKYVVLGIHVAGNSTTGVNSATRITMETLTRHIDRWMKFDDDDWVYYPWVDSPWLDVSQNERRKTWGKGFSPEHLAERADTLECPAFNTGGAIKTRVMPQMKWFNLFSYDSHVIEYGHSSYGMWVKWDHVKSMK